MYFRTQLDWAYVNPAFAAFDAPGNPRFRWRAVEVTMSTFYYHVHFVPNSPDSDAVETDVILGSIYDVMDILLHYPVSTLLLQIPAWLNRGEPGLYRVVAIYKPVDSKEQPFIAECADGALHVLDSLVMGKKKYSHLLKLNKVALWTFPKVKRKSKRFNNGID